MLRQPRLGKTLRGGLQLFKYFADDPSRNTGLTYRNGLSLSHGYDNQYRTSSIIVDSIMNKTYGYDLNGNIISILDAIEPSCGGTKGTLISTSLLDNSKFDDYTFKKCNDERGYGFL